MRSMEERGNTLLALGRESRQKNRTQSAESLEAEAVQMRDHANTIRKILLEQRVPRDE